MLDTPSIDKRITRTRAAIFDALIALIEQKGFDALSVKDITIRANINRSTFYLHFRDKVDVLEQIEASIIQDFEKIFIRALAFSIADIKNPDAPLPVVVSMFEYFRENARVFSALLELKGDFSLHSQIKKVVQKNLSLDFLSGVKSLNFLVPSEYLISYTISAHLGVVQTWLRNGCVETPQEMAAILSRLSFYGPLHAVAVEFDAG